MSSRKPKVAHFVRKDSQLRLSSFIRNQIVSHQHYEPVLVWRNHVPSMSAAGFADFDFSDYAVLDLSEGENWKEKALYAGPKMLSQRQVKNALRFLKRHEVSICHFHYGTDCSVFYPLLKKIGVPSVASFYGYDCSSFPRLYFGYGATFLKKRVFDDISAVMAMSPDMKTDLIRAGCPENKIVVHYYGTDTERFFMERDYPGKGSVTLLILATLAPQKGHLALLKSIKRLMESGVSNFTLRIVGSGELEHSLKAYVRDNGLSQNVIFTGAVKYASDEMMAEYRNADIFVHPSVEASNGDKEGIPGTIVEAMSAGLPVVSTHHAGIPYIIENERTGFLTPEYDEHALSGTLKRLIADAGLRKRAGLAGQKYACQHLALAAREQELEEIYGRLIHAGKAVKI